MALIHWVWGLATAYRLLGVGGITTQSGIHSSELWGLLRPPCVCAICGANWAVLCCALKPTSKYTGSGASWLGLQCRPRSPLPVTGGRLPDPSDKVM